MNKDQINASLNAFVESMEMRNTKEEAIEHGREMLLQVLETVQTDEEERVERAAASAMSGIMCAVALLSEKIRDNPAQSALRAGRMLVKAMKEEKK